ncbi:MAG: hypothetical protein HY074_04645 [Deltaproteobacteria bacterium]|nr:hypothetical protein [Deltaproteobacteria bacterium]
MAANATSFVNRPMAEAVNEVPNIVRGKTGESYSDFAADKRRIFTYTHLAITDVLKGSIKDTKILLRSPGGGKDGQEMHVPGAAQFGQDEDVVLLLGEYNAEDKSYDIPGLTTGKYNVVTGEAGEPILVNSLGGAAMYDPRKDPATQAYNARVPLETFRRIAKGEDIPEAAHNQFEQSKAAPPPGAYEAGHNHPEITPQGTVPKPLTPDQVAPHVEAEHAVETKSSLWVPLSFALLTAVGALVLWLVLRPSKDSDSA